MDFKVIKRANKYEPNNFFYQIWVTKIAEFNADLESVEKVAKQSYLNTFSAKQRRYNEVFYFYYFVHKFWLLTFLSSPDRELGALTKELSTPPYNDGRRG